MWNFALKLAANRSYQHAPLICWNQNIDIAFPAHISEFEGFFVMVQTWASWKRFPDAQSGGHVEAPIGPGVYEVRHTLTGRLIAFGHSSNVANAISELRVEKGRNPFMRMFSRQRLTSRVSDLEYRTCAAASRAEAKTAAQRLMGLRQSAWRRRMDLGWSARLH
jgi:hypothetical protein